jgi:hypothetical protein
MESSGTWNRELRYLERRALVNWNGELCYLGWRAPVPGMESSCTWNGELWYLERRALVPGMESSGTWNGELWNLEWRALVPGMESSGTCNGEVWYLEWRALVRGMLGNKCAGNYLKTVHFRETFASDNFLVCSSAIGVFLQHSIYHMTAGASFYVMMVGVNP